MDPPGAGAQQQLATTLREQVMINQFVSVAGCATETARKLLASSHWHWEAALSTFLSDGVPPVGGPMSCHLPVTNHFSHLHAPANTPSTPPQFPEALLAFSKMSTGSNENSNSSTHRLLDSNSTNSRPYASQPQQ